MVGDLPYLEEREAHEAMHLFALTLARKGKTEKTDAPRRKSFKEGQKSSI